ncbi:MAG: flavohemoglobin expression-modulating QEGLA motif protein, partial [Hymenobacteraceae bacterium]|nr:flavohemoglobin expression-modulating QEGLA motif protein [Hymenobacteraceae bacterium]MDX5396582.1 flavohemoglobin expression-modulating QEGLA motif protein [Hymenobacteraceae bacterium]MDX5512645.1 flavohemoglobin expression-modulating QEGLA motif protein [Hymenobacteraceae bacterium]
GVDESLLKIAEGLLAAIPAPDQNAEEEVMPVKELSALEQSEIDFLRNQNNIVDAKVEIRPYVVSLMVSKGQFLIGKDAYIPRHRAEALIQHEVGTHVLTYYNGKAQPLQQLYAGVPGYEELQEGLAVLSEYLVGGLDHSRMRVLAARVVAVDKLINGCTFLDNFWMLHEKYHFHPEDAYDIAMRVHRGGGLTKDAVYLRGLVHLLHYLKEGHALEPLLIGKIRQDYIPIVQELIYRNILQPIPLRPRYLSSPATQEKLQKLKEGLTVFNLV